MNEFLCFLLYNYYQLICSNEGILCGELPIYGHRENTVHCCHLKIQITLLYLFSFVSITTLITKNYCCQRPNHLSQYSLDLFVTSKQFISG